jgi:hypothetical protein
MERLEASFAACMQFNPGHARVDPHKRKLHPETVAFMRLQSAILERRYSEFVDCYCEQGNALIV